MQDRTPWLYVLGGLWLVLGVVALLWSILAFLSVSPEILIALPRAVTVLTAVFRLSPWSQIALAAGAILGIVSGWALLQRYSWVQTILIPAHALSTLYAAVATFGVYGLQNELSEGWAIAILLLMFVALSNCVLAVYMSGIRSTEALSWIPLLTAPAIPSTCEFCGSPLDPETHLCPQCNTLPSILRAAAQAPRRAKLMSLANGSAYWLDPGKRTRIGRGLSGNDINLSNPTVSRQHAQIEYSEGEYVLTALQDSNGTYINDSRTRHHTLQDGDEICFGRMCFRFAILD